MPKYKTKMATFRNNCLETETITLSDPEVVKMSNSVPGKYNMNT